jgi:hypothetical protein
MRFDPKISSLEEREDLGTLSMDELHGIFTYYEMRIEQEIPVTKEAFFMASKKTKKKHKKNSKPSFSCSDYSDEDEEMANFVRKLKKGTGKYKGMLPMKCFNCGGIDHFPSKYHHKNKYNDQEEDYKWKNKYQKGNKIRNKSKLFKKSFYSKEDNFSLDEEDDDSDIDLERVLFMVVEYDSKEEGEVKLRAELISAIEELRKERKKNKSLKVELKMKKGCQTSHSKEIE